MCLWARKGWQEEEAVAHICINSLASSNKDKITALQIKATLFKIQTHTLGSQSSSSVFYEVFDVSTSSPRPYSTQKPAAFLNREMLVVLYFQHPQVSLFCSRFSLAMVVCWEFLKSLHWKQSNKIKQDFECPG